MGRYPHLSRRQTTVLMGGSNGTATLISLLGEDRKNNNSNHILRVVTRSPARFLKNDDTTPMEWKCREQKNVSDTLPLNHFPTWYKTHTGRAPHGVFDYEHLDQAISGESDKDDGDVADVILLCCPVSAHLPILQKIARTLYKLDDDGLLLGDGDDDDESSSSLQQQPPLLIGTLYAGGGFDWMTRMAFATEKPKSFRGKWSRSLALFGLKAFPYLCKIAGPGSVTLYGRYPELQCAVCPSTPAVRAHVQMALERILQCKENGLQLEFLGLGAATMKDGGDGSADMLTAGVRSTSIGKASASQQVTSTSLLTGRRVASTSIPTANLADPYGSLAFLACTLNCTNQLLHPSICSALFDQLGGTATWDASKERTPLPRFYADGAAKPEAGRLITTIAVSEFYPVMDALDAILAPGGQRPISSFHGGEPLGRFLLNATGNRPRDLAKRSGLTDMALWQLTKEENIHPPPIYRNRERRHLVNFRPVFEFLMSYGLSRNTRLEHVIAPTTPLPNDDDPNDKTTKRIKANVNTRFFTDDIPHGLCVVLGLAALLGFDLERDMPETLAVTRRLQSWMGNKEYVMPLGGGRGRQIVEDARDLGETSAPQALGIRTVQDLQRFLRLSPFLENEQALVGDMLKQSPKATNLKKDVVSQLQSKL